MEQFYSNTIHQDLPHYKFKDQEENILITYFIRIHYYFNPFNYGI